MFLKGLKGIWDLKDERFFKGKLADEERGFRQESNIDLIIKNKKEYIINCNTAHI